MVHMIGQTSKQIAACQQNAQCPHAPPHLRFGPSESKDQYGRTPASEAKLSAVHTQGTTTAYQCSPRPSLWIVLIYQLGLGIREPMLPSSDQSLPYDGSLTCSTEYEESRTSTLNIDLIVFWMSMI